MVVDCGAMRKSIGSFRDMLLGVCIIKLAKCLSLNPNIDSMHNENILKRDASELSVTVHRMGMERGWRPRNGSNFLY